MAAAATAATDRQLPLSPGAPASNRRQGGAAALRGTTGCDDDEAGPAGVARHAP